MGESRESRPTCGNSHEKCQLTRPTFWWPHTSSVGAYKGHCASDCICFLASCIKLLLRVICDS
jgi:hypothetical protein